MKDIEIPESPEDSDTDLDVEHIDDDPVLLAYGLHTKLKGYGFHYNSGKLKCKRLAITWIIATFLGYGYIFSGQEVGLPFNVLIAVAWISYLAAIGVLLLGFLDVVVYQRHIESIVMSTIKLEKEFADLPKTHFTLGKLLLSKSRIGPVRYDAFFYLVLACVLMIAAVVALVQYGSTISSAVAFGFLVGGVCIAGMVCGIAIVITARSSLINLHGEGHVPHK